jgi:glutaredoxin-related protein
MELSQLQSKIHIIRGEKIIFDFDLATLYEVETRVLKQSIRRNEYRFPFDFMFKLTESEWKEVVTNCDNLPESIKYSPQTPFAFSEQGVAMLSSILKSKKAVETNIAIMRTFVEIRKAISLQSEISQQIRELKNNIEERLGEHDVQLMEIYAEMERFLEEKAEKKEFDNRKKLGY